MSHPLSLALVGLLVSFGVVACSALADDGDSQTSELRAECTSGAPGVCTCGIRPGQYLCSARGRIPRDKAGKIECQCDDAPAPPASKEGNTTPEREPDPEPGPQDTTGDDAGPARNVAGDSCATIDRVPTREISKGSASRFPVEIGGLQDDFRSSCTQAIGPDRVQPLLARASGTMVVSVVSGPTFVGVPVLYAKADCGATTDLACSPTARQISFSVTQGKTYHLIVDTSTGQPSDAKVDVTAEIR